MNLKWIVFNVVVALVPVALAFFVVRMFRLRVRWFEILKDGELFIYSSTLSAATIGSMVMDSKLQRTGPFLVFWALILLLMGSSVIFGVLSYLKFTNRTPTSVRTVSAGSIICAAAVSGLSYYLAA